MRKKILWENTSSSRMRLVTLFRPIGWLEKLKLLLQDLVDLVPHLGGGDVFGSGLGVVAGASLDAGELFEVS